MTIFIKTLIIFVLIFNFLDEFVPYLTFTDEAFSIVFMVYSLIKLRNINRYTQNNIFTKVEIVIFTLVIMIATFSVISTVTSDVKNQTLLILYTLFANLKYILIYFSTRVLIYNMKYSVIKEFGDFIIKASYCISILLLGVYFLDLAINFIPADSYRFGMKNISYGFGIPSEFALTIIMLTAMNLYFNAIFYKKINLMYLLLNLFLLFTSGRYTSIAFFILIIILTYSYRYFRKFVTVGLIIATVVSFLVAKDRIISTFVDIEQARGVLLTTSIKIAKDYFPLGSGLGTFGSQASRINYSQVYYDYGLSGYYGLSPRFDFYITDSYWAMYIGENGFFIALLNLMVLVLLFMNSYRLNKGIIGFFVSIPILYIIISTPVDTAILSNSSLTATFILGLLVTIEKGNFKNKQITD